MAGLQGRLLALKLGDGASPEVFTTIAGIKTKGIAFANGTVDITTDDSLGIKTMLAGKYGMAATVTASGVEQDVAGFATLRTNFLAGTFHNYQIVDPGATSGGTYSFSGANTALEQTGETDDAIQFSITIESSGGVTVA